MLKYQIRNNFQTVTGQTFTVSGGTLSGDYKSLLIPISLDFFPVDYGEDVQDIVLAERKKAINPTFDAETAKYTFSDTSANSNMGMIIKFQFWDKTFSTYTTSYESADFTNIDVNKKRNGFKKSFFRLYFYDTNSGDTNNLIFTEDLDVNETVEPIIPFNRLYWLRNDDYFSQNNNNRIVYMDARFFNAKTGNVSRFINIPSYVTSLNQPLNAVQYSDPNNRDWRTSAVEIINPKLNNGGFNFRPYVPFGQNSINTITLTEFIMV